VLCLEGTVSKANGDYMLRDHTGNCHILIFSGRCTYICALRGKVEVAKVHILVFVQSGI
jgi:hypothetical protein